jgi:ribosome biogenesis GTPase A
MRLSAGKKDFMGADLNNDMLNERDGAPIISWYPGHIAKAERELSEYLKKVDVVIEVRDARIPYSTTHPKVKEWVGKRPLIVAVSRLDQISSWAQKEWKEYYAMNKEENGPKVYFIDGKKGAGVLTLRKQILKAGVIHNERRMRRGIAPRATRCAIIGYPNVGKSALINKILGKKMAKSRNMPGVTRSLQWVRIGGLEGDQTGAIELLDSPGIIPAQAFNQEAALKLAICNDIGEASYDRVLAAGAMVDLLNRLHSDRGENYVQMRKIDDRYGLRFKAMTGEEAVFEVADTMYGGNMISAADKLLGDFRKGYLGNSALEAAPQVVRKSKAQEPVDKEEETKPAFDTVLDVGKGNYDGW